MPAHFTHEPPQARVQVPKAVVATLAGVVVAAMAVVLSGARQVPATTSGLFVQLGPEGAGADNVVSAIIVDFRALDTVGEITVLFVAAVGVASLILATPFDRRQRRPRGPETVSRASELLLPNRHPVPAEHGESKR